MKKSIIFITMIISILVLGCNQEDISFDIEMKKNTFKQVQDITVKLNVKNNLDRKITFYDIDYDHLSLYSILILDSNNKEVELSCPYACFTTSNQSFLEKKNMITIMPHTSFERKLTLNRKCQKDTMHYYYDSLPIGKYSLMVGYNEKIVGDEKSWGYLSNKIKFAIVP